MDVFRVRLNCVDHYQAVPTPYDVTLRRGVSASQRANEPRVPVIRVFGSTETGQKVCAHVHGAFPYLYIDYGGSLELDQVGAYIHHLHLSIDHALAVSYRKNAYDGKNHYVARITLVKGIPFYGFHVGYQHFLKIYMLNPLMMTRVSDLLRQGAIMQKIFQPYESHLQYLLQWMTDYNLYGCGYVSCRKAYFRGPVPKYDELVDPSHLWHDLSIPPEYVLADGVLPRVSYCAIEVDICVQDIMNREEIKARPLHHDFIERLNPLNPQEKLVPSMVSLWRDETRRRKSQMVDPDPGSSPFPPEALISMSAESRSSQRGGWIHEDEYMEKVMDMINSENENSDRTGVSFDTFVRPAQLQHTVKTAFESVEDLYPENLGSVMGINYGQDDQAAEENVAHEQEAEVDINDIADLINFNDDEFPYDSDESFGLGEDLPQKKNIESLETPLVGSRGEVRHGHKIEESVPVAQQTEKQYSSTANSLHSRKLATPVQSLIDSVGPNSLERTPDFGQLPSSTEHEVTGMKRSKSQVGNDQRSEKRQRIDNKARGLGQDSKGKAKEQYGFDLDSRMLYSSDVEVLTGGAGLGHNGSTTFGLTTNTIPTAKFPEKSSQEILKSSATGGSKTLAFPVVKNPQEPSTILRLSQGNASQKSCETSSQKHVSFEVASRVSQEADTSSFGVSSIGSGSSELVGLVTQVLRNAKTAFSLPADTKILAINEIPPSASTVLSTMQDFGLPAVIYQDAYYSDESDVPERAREYAGMEFKLESLTVPFLPDFDATGSSPATYGEKPGVVVDKAKDEARYQRRRRLCKLKSWEIGEPPPTFKEVEEWAGLEKLSRPIPEGGSLTTAGETKKLKSQLSQIDGPSQRNKHGFKFTQSQKNTSVEYESQYMSTLSLEIHVNTRGKFVPNPEQDEVQCVFWCLQSDEDGLDRNGVAEGTHVGIVTLSEDGSMAEKIRREVVVEVQEESSELDLMIRIVQIVRSHDPDILTGYEVHGSSWGYLIERARSKYDYNLCDELSRMKSQSHGRFGKDQDKWGFNNTSTVRVTGRHMINIWRAMRGELSLLQYTLENVAFHLLHRRIPHYSWRDLTLWYTNARSRDLAKVLNYYVSRVQINLEILERNELIPRTSEQARLLGVDFFSVFSRGSQFKVESLMFRIAKPENFILVSPSRKQVGGQNALECLPLVMEPQSAFYNSPLLVLDFQSLYPSVMIAYNYCYSTFLGRINDWRGTSKMGFTEYKRQRRLLGLLQEHINIAPNGMMFVKPDIRKSLLAKMLGEILETRVMVKSGMKMDKDDRILQSLLNNRQLALKLIANVTYGYTSASFSGRMPCSEIADSIVQTARETLEKTIALIHSVQRWGAEVVYGDTDSLFIYLRGRTKDQAFDIGNEIVKMVTNINPRPVKLKFEKVYLPCVLLAKKRYVGFKYESRDQQEPEFDAKGIETVRRDGTPAEQKIEEKALKILFRTADLSQVKDYFQDQCNKIMKGSVSIQDFCFAREVKLGTYSEKGIPTAGALISTRRMLEDSRAEPQYGERIPYVVVTGAPGARLIDRCVSPSTLLSSPYQDLDAEYYISKNIIPPLERIFNLVGANVRNWYDEMPKVHRIRRVNTSLHPAGSGAANASSRKTLESYLHSSSCIVCRGKLSQVKNPVGQASASVSVSVRAKSPICPTCLSSQRSLSLLTLRTRLSVAERKVHDIETICRSCAGLSFDEEIRCDSLDCGVFYSRVKARAGERVEREVAREGAEALLRGEEGGIGLGW